MTAAVDRTAVHMADDPQALSFDWPRVPARNESIFGAWRARRVVGCSSPGPRAELDGPLYGPSHCFEWAGMRAPEKFPGRTAAPLPDLASTTAPRKSLYKCMAQTH